MGPEANYLGPGQVTDASPSAKEAPPIFVFEVAKQWCGFVPVRVVVLSLYGAQDVLQGLEEMGGHT